VILWIFWWARSCIKEPALAAALLVTVAGFWPLQYLGSEFIPPLDEGDIMYMPTTAANISVGKAREILQ
ncbi:hypothetical protein, partial [Aeromonas salmonicida]|uniref:hypothetical protein n=1 Tax=Aeromonas salmonicida TaxID=645 RepID=UPI003D317D65